LLLLGCMRTTLASGDHFILFHHKKMRITVDIDAKVLRQIQTFTGQKKKSPAVSQALDAYLRQEGRRKLIERALSGETDFTLTNDELEGRDVYEAR
jgi:Arc/MetJ family transcription regulator